MTHSAKTYIAGMVLFLTALVLIMALDSLIQYVITRRQKAREIKVSLPRTAIQSAPSPRERGEGQGEGQGV